MHHDVIVIGLGAMGSATLWQLAQRGARVLGIDRFAPPHDQGSSHGHSRITRLAVGEGPEYVPLAQRSHVLWRELEAASGEQLMLQTGGLVIGPLDGRSMMHGQADFVGRTVAIAQQAGIAHELLNAAQLAARWPQLILQGDERGYFEPEAGLLRPERCVAVQLALAQQAGAQVLTHTPVLDVSSEGGDVVVRTAQGTHRAGRVVLSAGAWTPALAGGRYASTLRVQRQTLQWFATERAADYAPERFPVFIWSHGADVADSFYGFPMADGVPGLKVATEQYDIDTLPDAVDRHVSDAEIAAVHAHHVQGRLRGVLPHAVQTSACMYTAAPQCRFVIDRHPALDKVLVVSACSGHGFKHSAAVGEAVAQTVLDGHATIPLAPFAWDARDTPTA